MSTSAIELSPRRGGRSACSCRTEIKLALRRPVGVIVALGIPVLLLVVFGSIPSTTRASAALGGISFFNLYVPTLMVFVLIAVGLGEPSPDARRPTASRACCAGCRPLRCRPSWLLAAQMTINVILATLSITILVGAGSARLRTRRSRPRRRRVAGDPALARPHDRGDARTRAVRGRVAPTPQIAGAMTRRSCSTRWRSSRGCTSRSRRSTHQRSTTSPRWCRPEPDSTRCTRRFSGTSPGVEPLLVLAGWAIVFSLAAAAPVPLGVDARPDLRGRRDG